MSLNLLANYGSDDSGEEENNEDFGNPSKHEDDEEEIVAGPADEQQTESTNVEAPQKSFFSSDFVSSSDDEDDDDIFDEDDSTVPRLPSARSVLTGTAKLESSLFISEAEKEQNERNALLSQHVPVSEQVKKEQRQFRGKRKGQPCRAFLAGSCTRGVRCRFSHVLPESRPVDDPLSATIESKPSFYTDANEVFNKKAKLN